MRFLFILLFMAGCASVTHRDLKPIAIYTLDDGSKIKVYRTHNEKIYIRNTSFDVIPK